MTYANDEWYSRLPQRLGKETHHTSDNVFPVGLPSGKGRTNGDLGLLDEVIAIGDVGGLDRFLRNPLVDFEEREEVPELTPTRLDATYDFAPGDTLSPVPNIVHANILGAVFRTTHGNICGALPIIPLDIVVGPGQLLVLDFDLDVVYGHWDFRSPVAGNAPPPTALALRQ